MSTPHTPPSIELDAYNCPHCDAFTEQREATVSFYYPDSRGRAGQDDWLARTCARCGGHSVWREDVLVFPRSNPAPSPNPDLSADILRDYEEAAQIVTRSPRGAAALLRLAIQKLTIELGGKGKSIDADIGTLVANGLPERVQQAMDVLRVIGNNAVHPGSIDLSDDIATALQLFELTNLVAETMITEPKRVEELYQKLPVTAREAIEKRDAPKP